MILFVRLGEWHVPHHKAVQPARISFITIREFPDLFFLCIGAFAPVVLLSLFALQLCDAYIYGALTPHRYVSSFGTRCVTL